MRNIVIVHRSLSNLKTGGHYYLANTISYLREKKLNLDVIDFNALPQNIKRNRFHLVLYLLRTLLKQPKNTFNFTNHNLYFYLLLPYLINRIRGNKYGCGCHLTQYNLRKNIFMRWFEFLCEYLFLQGAALIILPSKAAEMQFDIFHLRKKDRSIIKPAPNITGRAKPRLRKQIRNLIFVGHIEWRKGLDVLLKAMAALKDMNLHLEIAGHFDKHSDYFKTVENIIEVNRLGANITFHGRLDPQQLYRLYEKGDLFVFPSRHETYGMVLVEAMSFGLPIVASKISTTMEIMENNVNGILYETESVEALARAIRRLSSASDLRCSIVRNNVRISKNIRTWFDVGRENLLAISRYL